MSDAMRSGAREDRLAGNGKTIPGINDDWFVAPGRGCEPRPGTEQQRIGHLADAPDQEGAECDRYGPPDGPL
jgi:hypothetical protein